MIRVAALYRLSTKKQVARKRDDEVDIPSQKRAVERFMSHHPEWELVAQYEEKGVSAFKKTAAQREVLQQALADARDGKWKVLLCFKGDRLSRKGFGYLDVLAELEGYGVETWAVADNRLLSMEDEQLIVRAAEAYAANQESKKTSQRVRERMWGMAEDGRWTGGRIPFGYKLVQKVVDGQVVVRGGRIIQELVPGDDAAVVVEMFDKYVSGWGFVRIAGWMNSIRIPCFRAEAWTRTTVAHVINNSFYAGFVIYGRRSSQDGVEPVRAKGMHQPLISEEMWDQAQSVRLSRKHNSLRDTRSVYILSGILRCALCGGKLHGRTQRFARVTGGVRVYQWYRCGRSQRAMLCPAKNISAKKLEASLVDEVERLTKVSDLRTFLVEYAEADNRMFQADADEKKRATEELSLVEKALQKLDRTYFETDALSPQEYKAKKDDYLAQKNGIERILAKPAITRPPLNVEELIEIASNMRELWYSAERTPEELRAWVLAFVTEWNLTIFASQDGTVTLRTNG